MLPGLAPTPIGPASASSSAATLLAVSQRVQLVVGGAIVLAIIGAIVAAIVAPAGSGGDGPRAAGSGADAPIPARKVSDFDAAVRASGCTFRTWPDEGREHLSSDTATYTKYKTNPPTSGPHRPTAAQDGIYRVDDPPATENAVHALEHGRIDLQYAPSAPAGLRAQLETLVNEKNHGVEGYHLLLFANQTRMPYEVAATAWRQSLTCERMNPRVWDALRAFRDRFTDKGPELIP